MNSNYVVGLISVVLLVTFLAMAGCSGCSVIQGGSVGVKRNFGKIQAEELTPGIYFIMPFVSRVASVDTQMRSYEIETEASSKDLQSVKTKVSLQHNIQPDMAAETYEAIGDLTAVDDRVIKPAASEVLKAVTAQYTAEELITKRAEVKQKITDGIQTYIATTFSKRGLDNNIHIDNVAITDFDFSHEFNMSIESKVKAEQEALKAENEKKKKITDAEATARELELKADSQAYQIKTESIERADAIKRESEALSQNPLLIQLRAIEAWDGKLPTYMLGEGMNMLMQVPQAKEPVIKAADFPAEAGRRVSVNSIR